MLASAERGKGRAKAKHEPHGKHASETPAVPTPEADSVEPDEDAVAPPESTDPPPPVAVTPAPDDASAQPVAAELRHGNGNGNGHGNGGGKGHRAG